MHWGWAILDAPGAFLHHVCKLGGVWVELMVADGLLSHHVQLSLATLWGQCCWGTTGCHEMAALLPHALVPLCVAAIPSCQLDGPVRIGCTLTARGAMAS